MGRHHRCGEVKRRHCGELVARQRIVKAGPVAAPEALSGLGHDAAHVGQAASRARPPRGGGRHQPVDRRSQVENRRHLRRRPGEALGMAPKDPSECHMRSEEPRPVDDREHVVVRVHLVRRPKRPLEPDRRDLAQADRAVDPDRVVHACAPYERLVVVVRQLVVRDVRPHLGAVHGGVAKARARERERDGQRRLPGDDRRHRARDPQAAARERNGDAG